MLVIALDGRDVGRAADALPDDDREPDVVREDPEDAYPPRICADARDVRHLFIPFSPARAAHGAALTRSI
jgi:hypothetical protein